MKKVYLYGIVVVVLVGAVYLWMHRGSIGNQNGLNTHRYPDGTPESTRIKPLDWRPVDESVHGFKLEMPGQPQQIVVQATSEAGTPEPISMLIVKVDPDTTFAIAWAENPPVARINEMVADKTLDSARDRAVASTQTTIINESRSTPQGFPGRDFEARSVGGGFLDARFIYAGPRLYMLEATTPSVSARHEEEVMHFFNSFKIASNKQVPEALPAATTTQ